MSLVNAHALHLSYGRKVILEDAGFAIGPTDRVGLVGANGTGKSTLMKILAGRLEPDGGRLSYRRHARVGYLPQDITGTPEGNLLEAVLASVPGRETLEGELRQTQAELEDADDEARQLELSAVLAELHETLEQFEARHGKHRAERILQGLGFTSERFGAPVASLSGGWRMRAALAGLLLQDPDLLLLDEPTNHLDLPTLTWFDGFLRRSNKALVLISHDRDFLNRQINRVISLEVEGLRTWSGNYDQYKRQRAEEKVLREAEARKVEQKKAELQGFIDRFGAKATKATQAQSRAKQLEKLESVQLLEERSTMQFRFPKAQRSGRDVVTFEGLHKSFGARAIYDGVEGTVERGARIAIIGANGAGKTTLLKMLAGELPPDAGSIRLGHNVELGYYAQHHADTLDASASILGLMQALVPGMPERQIRSILGAFLFSGDDVEKRVGVLSGGERARVALARLLLQPSNLLVMDEPTNHLDLDSSEMLIEALRSYEGTLMFVSHNRSFINQLATAIWEVKDGQVLRHPGNLDDWTHHQSLIEAAEEGDADARVAGQAERPQGEKARRRQAAEDRQRRQAVEGPLKKQIARAEQEIARLETTLAEQGAQLADPAFYEDFDRAKPVMDAHREGTERLELLYAEWEGAQAKLEELQASDA